MGELMVLQLISFAQFEQKTTVERIKNGVHARAERGLTNGGSRLLGYDPHPDKRCHLVVNEKEKPIVQLIFQKFLELGSISSTISFLNSNGYKTKSYITTKAQHHRGGSRWTHTTTYRTLTNLTYVGKREYNKTNRNKDQESLKRTDKYKIYDGQWEPIISQEIFDEVQSTLSNNKKSLRKTKSKFNYTLSGLLYCDLCGEKLVGKSTISNDKPYYYVWT